MSAHVDDAAKNTLDSLRRFSIPIAGKERAIVLYPPSYDAVVPGLMDQPYRDERERGIVMGELIQILQIDGEWTYSGNADPILDDRAALDAILHARECLYRFLVEQGRIYAVCPRCGVTRELDLAFYARTLALPPIRVTDRSFIATPALARPSVAPPPILRPYEEREVLPRRLASRTVTLPRAARIDFVVPSARVGISEPDDVVSGTLGDVEQSREIEAWRRWAPPRADQPTGRNHYRADHPGFRAMLRLAVALGESRTVDARLVEPTPEVVANMYLADVQFLDLLYTATHDLVVEPPLFGQEPDCTIHCSCGQAYLPVR